MMKIEDSGSISQRHGSADPDPHQNAMDPEHWFLRPCSQALPLSHAGHCVSVDNPWTTRWKQTESLGGGRVLHILQPKQSSSYCYIQYLCILMPSPARILHTMGVK